VKCQVDTGRNRFSHWIEWIPYHRFMVSTIALLDEFITSFCKIIMISYSTKPFGLLLQKLKQTMKTKVVLLTHPLF